MPILDVDIVARPGEPLPPGLARGIADAAGAVFGSPPGTTWVKLRALPGTDYAENDVAGPEGERAVFVRILQARAPAGEARVEQARRLAEAIAGACGRPPENVHLLYEPDAIGRIAFGGRLREG